MYKERKAAKNQYNIMPGHFAFFINSAIPEDHIHSVQRCSALNFRAAGGVQNYALTKWRRASFSSVVLCLRHTLRTQPPSLFISNELKVTKNRGDTFHVWSRYQDTFPILNLKFEQLYLLFCDFPILSTRELIS